MVRAIQDGLGWRVVPFGFDVQVGTPSDGEKEHFHNENIVGSKMFGNIIVSEEFTSLWDLKTSSWSFQLEHERDNFYDFHFY